MPDKHLRGPRGISFNPVAPAQLYVANSLSDSLIELNTSATPMTYKHLKDRAQYHYLDHVSGVAFDSKGQFATCQESLNTYEGQMLPNFFMGPTMYDSRLPLVSSRQLECGRNETCFLVHTDMLHEAPLCMGIAHDGGAAAYVRPSSGRAYENVYWVVDGGHGQLVRFDFQSDHGPGSMDHSYADVRRYQGLSLTRVPHVPSGLVVDDAARKLLVADTGADRVLIVDVDSGRYSHDAKPTYQIYSSPSSNFSYAVWTNLSWRVLGHVPRPSAIALAPDGTAAARVVYVASWTHSAVYGFEQATGRLVGVQPVYAGEGLAALALHPLTGELWVANARTHRLGRIRRVQSCALPASDATPCANGARDGEETDVDCGGRACARCARNASCSVHTDCASGSCARSSPGAALGVCGLAVPVVHDASFLLDYLSSDFYRSSFQHHLAHGSMGGASYLNPYPIMASTFCEEVGVNASSGLLDCARIDYDALLLAANVAGAHGYKVRFDT